ncbi:MAG TPA: amino acid ABC transporter permease [Eubacteriales bacterium]|nr:amino acid ABC transporter permease [Eubacteriales bacterium]
MTTFITVTLKLLQGFGTTILIFLVTLLCAVPLGLPIAFCSMSRFKPLRWLSRGFVWIIRGTPLMLQVIIVFYGPDLLGWNLSFPRFGAVAVAFIINYAAYFSEIYRGGIESVPRGQYEAGQVLGLKKGQIFFRITLPQVIKRILAPMSNEVITLVKDTSLARVIAVRELIMEASAFIKTQALLWPLFYSGAFYLLFCGLLTLAFGALEKKLDYIKV